MDITLVTSSYDKIVHGTENEKKTGCGINLLKPENVTRYHRGSMMTDLKEITCEKCKASLAKKMIKADKKEMSRLLKEEKQLEKMGMGDVGIVPLGNTTARITRDPDARRKEEEARRKAAEEARRANEEARRAAEEAEKEAMAAKNEPANFIPGTGVEIDDSLSQFAINVPHEEPAAPTAAAEDDFLAQFAIQKPDEELHQSGAAVSQPQDDFLAQFAIPSPQSDPVGQQDTADNYYNPAEEPEEMDGLDFSSTSSTVHAYGVPSPAAQANADDDIMKMFSIDSAPEQPAYGQPQYEQPAYGQPQYEQPVYGQPQYEQPAYGQPQYEQPAYGQPQYEQPAYGQPQYEQPVYGQPFYGQKLYDINGNEIPAPEFDPSAVPVLDQDLTQSTEWDFVANQLFGVDGVIPDGAPVPVQTAPVYGQFPGEPSGEMEELDIPAIDNIEAPSTDALQTASEADAHVIDEIPAVEDIAAPVLDEIPAVENIAAPVLDEIPTVEDIAAPVLDEIPAVEDIAAPVLDEIPAVEDIAVPVLDGIPAVEDIAAPVLDEIPAGESIPAPVLDDINAAEYMAAPMIGEIYEPILNVPQEAEEEIDVYMNEYDNNLGLGEETNQAAEQPKQAQPQIISVPQLAGYDANNQPVYKYVQMKLAGYDQKGQPVYIPVNAQPKAAAQGQRPAAPAQQTAAQAQSAAAAPVQQAAVKSPVPKKPVQSTGVPKANISQIAVNPHTKSTSQAFINAIASSKEYADKNLIDTQGLKANSPILTSVEDVLTTMGDETAKRKTAAAQQAVPVFDEYKAPSRSSSPFRGGSVNRASSSSMPTTDARYMTKSELKAKKKQDKIEAKFKKEMSKRGF
ncbi:MAG: hypothetical protein IKH78_05255 [Ruminococcus sp.]|nr:hypothetical protein [Ruminococcus sp.]